MTPERYREVTELFEQVVDLDEDERASALDRACANDPELRSAVMALIDSDAAPRFALEGTNEDLERVGRYRIERRIGEGGMGVVLEGVDDQVGRNVAVKVLRRGLSRHAEFLDRFLQEARIGGRLEHPGIVPVYEVGDDESRGHYFTMRLVDGTTLTDLLAGRESAAADLHRFLSIFEQVCHAIAYAHARGVVHRDLKPSNILVGPFGEVQVLDWGLAKGIVATSHQERSVHGDEVASGRSDMTRAGSVLGTPAYMSPEQARGDHAAVDQRSDVFTLGGILCEILTGAPPYEGESEVALRLAKTGELDAAITRLRGCGADGEIVQLAIECLSARPWASPTRRKTCG